MSERDTGHELAVGDEIELEVGAVGHGGVCVARADGRVVFVRYALPGERAVVRITEVRHRSYCRGEAVRILRRDPCRVEAPCAHFGPGGCGGCDFQHASLGLQRELKAAVVCEQFRRLAGLDVSVTVEELPGGGFGWRSRVRWAVARDRRGSGSGYDVTVGPRRYRSHEPVPVSAERPCLIAADGLSEAAAELRPPRGADQLSLVRTSGGPPVVAGWRGGRVMGQSPAGAGAGAGGRAGAAPGGRIVVTERAGGRSFAVAATGFWQAHRHAADTLYQAVEEALDEALGGAGDGVQSGGELTGGTAWDLYGGVGLFAAALADRVGPGGRVVTMESDRHASALAAQNLADRPQVSVVASRVAAALSGSGPRCGPAGAAGESAVHVVILDPPRSGAGADVCRGIAARRPRLIVYVACDPAALARDARTLIDAGYRLDKLRAFDAFPQTHHVECVARFTPVA